MSLVVIFSLLVTFLTLANGQVAHWGPNVHFGPTKSEIVGMSVTLIPGHPPAKEVDFVAIWPGLWNPHTVQYDLVQSVIASHKRSYMEWFCKAKPGQWCARAYVLRSGRPVTPGKGYAIDGTDELKIEYYRNATGDGKWLQILTNLSKGKKLVEFFAGDRPATIMETDTEMQQEGRGTSDTQVYTNLTLTLAIAEPDFEKTMVKGKNVQITRPQTADGGRTWRVEKIIIPAILPGTQWVPPAGKSKSSSSTGFGSSGRNEGKNGSEESSSSGTSDGGRPTWIPKGWIPTDGGMFGKGTRGKVTNRFMRR